MSASIGTMRSRKGDDEEPNKDEEEPITSAAAKQLVAAAAGSLMMATQSPALGAGSFVLERGQADAGRAVLGHMATTTAKAMDAVQASQIDQKAEIDAVVHALNAMSEEAMRAEPHGRG